MTMELKSDRKIDWATPAGCPDGFQTRRVYAGRVDAVGGSPLENAVAGWSKHERVSREALLKLHTAFTTVVREIPSRSAICFFGTPSAASPRINAQSSKVITLQSSSVHFSSVATDQFSSVVDTGISQRPVGCTAGCGSRPL